METKNIYSYHIYYIQTEVNVQNIKLIFEFIMFMVQYTTIIHLLCNFFIILFIMPVYVYYVHVLYLLHLWYNILMYYKHLEIQMVQK